MQLINKTKNIIFIMLFLLLIFSSTIYAVNNLKVHFIDVGQADCIFAQLPSGQNLLIDAGNNADGPDVVNYLKNQGVKKIDFLIGTHPHEDHIGGLDDVIKSFTIGKIYMPEVIHTSKTFEDVLLAVKNKSLKIKAAKAGTYLLNTNDLKLRILSPVRDDYDDLNNWSIVLKLDYKNTSFLFTGDAEKVVEKELLNSNFDLNADVLKVSHHGSNTSTSSSFLKAVTPQYAVISVGKNNDYGHPSATVLNRLNKAHIKMYRTDQQGTIVVESDGQNLNFTTDPVNFNTALDEQAKSENKNNNKSNIEITALDLNKEYVVISNNSDQSINLSGWKLVSVKGNQVFIFPEKTKIAPGKKITVVSGRKAETGQDKIIWTKSYIWNNDGDSAVLYNKSGKLISTFE